MPVSPCLPVSIPGAPPAASSRRFLLLVGAGSLALLLGLAVYLTGRDPARVMLMPAWPALPRRAFFGTFGLWLPSFVHPLAFSLFTAALLPPGAAVRRRVCVAWGVINLLAELGQHAAFKSAWAAALNTAAGDGLLLRPLLQFWLRGTFDLGDLLAVILGALAAAAYLRFVDARTEVTHGSP